MPYPLLTEPIYSKTIWAGTGLDAVRGEEAAGAGASWEVSVRADSASPVANGPLAGRTLWELVREDPAGMLGDAREEQIMRVGILDAGEPLSVQVHPDEAYAQEHEGDHGKNESWYVVAAEPGARIVAGCDLSTTDEVRAAVEDGTIGDHLVRLDVAAGDFAHVSQGELHALGAGVLAVEMSTNSDTTYRFYDYDRVDAQGNKRELHVEKALEVCDPHAASEVTHHPLGARAETGVQALVACDQYVLELVDVAGEARLSCDGTPDYLTVVDGSCTVRGGDGEAEVPYLRSVFVPAGVGEYVIEGTCRVMRGRAL